MNRLAPQLLERVEQIARLIRSKGVGVYFASQSPADIPATILGQLGNRVQHALRAATARDQKEIRAAADTLPGAAMIDVAGIISTLKPGAALVSLIGADGSPRSAELAAIALPACRLGPLAPNERAAHLDKQTGTPGATRTASRPSQWLLAQGILVLVVGWTGALLVLIATVSGAWMAGRAAFSLAQSTGLDSLFSFGLACATGVTIFYGALELLTNARKLSSIGAAAAIAVTARSKARQKTGG